MTITSIRQHAIHIPLARPLRTSIHAIDRIGAIIVTVEGVDGIVGEGCLITLGGSRLGVLQSMIDDLAPAFIGQSPHSITAMWKQCWDGFNFISHKGIPVMALSALDMAVWDLHGKTLGQPLHHIWGAARERVRAYASGGLFLSLTIDELQAEAQDFLAQGFTAMKVRLGSPQISEDVKRVQAVRDVIGPDIDLMADSNQGLSVKHAIRLAKAMEPFDLFWFEEPVPYWDLEGHSRIRDAIPSDLASGETEYSKYGMRDMIEKRACDILMPDLQRIGGYSEFLRVGHLADAFDIPVTPHLFTEHSLCLAGALSNCTIVEHMPWLEPTLKDPPALTRDGFFEMSNQPGHGMVFDMDQIEKMRVS